MIQASRTLGIVVFSGTNCQHETKRACELVGLSADIVFYREIVRGDKQMSDYAGWLIPGGFSFGDHIGSGRVAGYAFGDYLRDFAATGRPMVGICNGDQILFEAGLFRSPSGVTGGALIQNESGRFEHGWINILALPGSPWTEGFEGATLRLPVAHGEGRWLVPEGGIPDHLTPVFQYVRDGVPTEEYPYNPSGTPQGICGLAQGNILGMMPHPERADDPVLGSTGGLLLFRNLAKMIFAA